MPEHINKINDCIDIAEVEQAMRAKEKVQIIDVRSREEFESGHIPNALNIALKVLVEKIPILDKNTQFVIACEKGGRRSETGAKLLKEFGLNANWLCGGTNKWLNSKG